MTPTAPSRAAALPAAAPRIVPRAELSPDQRDAVRRHFLRSIFAALTPLALGPGCPFPRLVDGTLAVAVALRRRRETRLHGPLLAVVQLPAVLPRMLAVPCEGERAFALLEDAVLDGIGELFPGRVVQEAAVFRVAGPRLELESGASRRIERALASALKRDGREVDRVAGPLRPADLCLLEGVLHPGVRVALPPTKPAVPAAEPPDREPIPVGV
jgi:polyphosphate kinase